VTHQLKGIAKTIAYHDLEISIPLGEKQWKFRKLERLESVGINHQRLLT